MSSLGGLGMRSSQIAPVISVDMTLVLSCDAGSLMVVDDRPVL